MKPLTNSEVQTIARDLQSLVGAQLQEFWQLEGEVGLGFYHERSMVGLIVTLDPQAPMLVRVSGVPKGKKLTRPLTLFARSRLVGRRLADVGAVDGRILLLSFHRAADEKTTEPAQIELRLFPHGQNVIVRDGASQVAEIKPRDLPEATPNASTEGGRTWEEIELAWETARTPAAPKAKAESTPTTETPEQRDWRKLVTKKEKALEQMRLDLERKLSGTPAEAGHWLKARAQMPAKDEIPPEFADFIDPDDSLATNLERCFHRAKENARKAAGARERIAAVESELLHLKSRGPQAIAKIQQKQEQHRREDLLARADAKGRRHKVAEDLDVFIGKSAADNLALLRRAQPFDYWLHLRERPGSHAIMRRTRTRIVTDAEFREAGRWVVEQSVGKRASELRGESYDLLIVECRYVRPIKGDSLGRVHYTNDRVMRLGF